MALMDEFKEEREAVKQKSLKEKLRYFWDYYKYHTIFGIAALIFIVTFIQNMATQKDTVFYAAIINAIEAKVNAQEAQIQDFAAYAGIDTEEYNISFQNNLFMDLDVLNEDTIDAAQQIAVYIASSELDILCSSQDTFEHYAYINSFYDLRDFLTEEQIEKYKPYFYYVDKTIIEQSETVIEELETYDPEYPDPTKPELMDNPVPVGIFVTDRSNLQEHYYFAEEVVLGVLSNTPRPEMALKYIEYLFEE